VLQIHPLEGSGRAISLSESVPESLEGAYALLEVERLRAGVRARLRLQIDLASKPTLIAAARVASEAQAQETRIPLGQLLSPLVVEPDGRCVPLEYGFPDQFSLGNIIHDRLCDLADVWKSKKLAEFQRLCRDVLAELCSREGDLVVNWYTELASAATAG
jgi:hypothetical protein